MPYLPSLRPQQEDPQLLDLHWLLQGAGNSSRHRAAAASWTGSAARLAAAINGKWRQEHDKLLENQYCIQAAGCSTEHAASVTPRHFKPRSYTRKRQTSTHRHRKRTDLVDITLHLTGPRSPPAHGLQLENVPIQSAPVGRRILQLLGQSCGMECDFTLAEQLFAVLLPASEHPP